MITLQRIHHRQQERILLKPTEWLAKDEFAVYAGKVTQVAGWAYSKTHQGYLVPCTRQAFDALQKLLGPENLQYDKKEPQHDAVTHPVTAEPLPVSTETEPLPAAGKTAAEMPVEKEVNKEEKPVLPSPKPEETPGKLPMVILKPIFVGKQERILFTGDYPKRLDNLVLKKVPGARYNDPPKGWHVPLNDAVYKEICRMVNGIALLETTALKTYLIRRKLLERSAPVPISPQTTAERTWQSEKISTENLAALERLVQQLVLEGLSENTIKTYRSEFNQFLYWAGAKPVTEMEPDHLRGYMEYCLLELKISKNTAHSRLNALKAYFEKVLKKEKFFYDIPRPKKHKSLPKILSEEELGRLFSAVEDLKYKAVLFTAYSAGLRVSEAVGLRQEDIDRDRMELFIYKAKGDKDRVVPLSPLVSDILKKHFEKAKKKPLKYVFEGDIPGKELSANSASNAFKDAKNASEILKSVTFHSLRHSFATHMLEKGVSTRYIQDILGHFNIKTTELYLHVARTKLINLPSPLDDLWQKGGIEF